MAAVYACFTEKSSRILRQEDETYVPGGDVHQAVPRDRKQPLPVPLPQLIGDTLEEDSGPLRPGRHRSIDLEVHSLISGLL